MNKVTPEQINALLDASTVWDHKQGEKTTVVTITLPNGFEITESSSCVDPDNYDHQLGIKIAMRRIADKLWMLEGYRLQCALAGPLGTGVIPTAKACHEANRRYCESLGDTSQPAWEDAPDWQKSSAIAGVEALLANPSLTPEQMHERWMERKRVDGWTYGPVKDPECKEHPCMTPYAELPPEQQAKDHLFQRVARFLLFGTRH